jgi:site-specific DNA-methyltransferase (adenine-specific)
LDRVIHGDNCETLAAMPAGSVDLVVTSPPYDDLRTYGGHSWDFERLAGELTRVLKPGGVIVWVVADATVNGSETLTSMRQAIHFKDVCGLNVHDTMIYAKANVLPCNGRRYEGQWEYAFVFSKGRPNRWNPIKAKTEEYHRHWKTEAKRGHTGKDGVKAKAPEGFRENETKTIGNLWVYNLNRWMHDGDSFSHPAPFPIALAKDHVASWSNPGDVVLDPFAGSGTTLKAAKELGRRFVGIEINAEYVEICQRRIAQEVLNLFPDNV